MKIQKTLSYLATAQSKKKNLFFKRFKLLLALSAFGCQHDLLGEISETLIETDNAVISNVTATEELQVSGNAFIDGSIVLGGPENPVQLNGQTVITKGTHLGNLNQWDTVKLYDPLTRNFFASADKKFNVTLEGNFVDFRGNPLPEPNIGLLFDGEVGYWNGNPAVAPGETVKVKIDFTKQSNKLIGDSGNAVGKIIVNTTYNRRLEVTAVRLTDTSDNVISIAPENIVNTDGKYAKTIWELTIRNHYYVKAIEIEIRGVAFRDYPAACIGEIEYYRDVVTSEVLASGSALLKYGPETLYESLTFKDRLGNNAIVLDPESGTIVVDQPAGDIPSITYTQQ